MPVTSPMTAPAPDKAPSVVAKPWYHMVSIDGLADSYYMYNMTAGGTDATAETEGNAVGSLLAPTGRAFDTQSNSFTLNYAKLGVGVSAENVAGRIDLGYGHTGVIINSASGALSGSSTASPASALYGNGFLVQQAFASLILGQVTLDFGKFVTTAGSEVIEANKNWMYSRSFLFNAIPLLHTGARVNFKASDMLTVQASVVNGWNNDPENNGDKTFGLSIAATPNQMINVVATGYFGKEGPLGVGNTTILTDLVVGMSLTPQFGFNLNIDYLKNSPYAGMVNTDPYLFGAAAMGRYIAAEHLVLAMRAEYIKDHGTYFGMVPDVNLFEATLALAAPFSGHYELRVELRGDFASEDVFTNGSEPRANQFTGTVAALAYF